MNSFFFSVFCLVTFTMQQACPSYAQNGIYSSGKITPISSFTTNTSISPTNTTIYSVPLDIITGYLNPNQYYLALGVVGIEALSSNQLSFNVSVLTRNQTGFSIYTRIIGFTYCSHLSYHYFAISYPQDISQMLIYFDCFLTSELSATPQKTASQTFQLQSLPFSDSEQVRNIYSVLSGMRLINNQGQYFSVSLKSTIPSGTNKIQHTITTDYYNNLEFVCMSTIVISESYLVQSYIHQIYYNTAIIDQANFTSNIQTFPKFQSQKMQFYGISSLQLDAQEDISFSLDTQNYHDIGPGSTIGIGVSTILLSYMYFAQNLMNNYPGQKYVPDSGQCVASCSTLAGYSLYASKTCQKCYYTCYTCTLPHKNGKCNTCNAAVFRTKNAATNQCLCNSGYVDVGVQICKSCSSLIDQCLTCSSQTYCLTCNINFVLSTDHTQCLCPGGGPKVNTFCLDYVGCLIAGNATNMIYCDVCDEENHFQKVLQNYTCTCMSGFKLSGITCDDICGDGRLQNITQGCDDGNLDDGDACSSNCTIQSGYACYTADNSTPSVCSKIVDFQISYVYSYRVKDRNAATMVFLISPSLEKLSAMKFDDYIQISLPYKSFSSYYDSASSTLIITSDFNTSIENTDQILKVSFDPSFVSCEPISVAFKPTGVNHQLVIDAYIQFNFYIKWVSLILSYLALLITLGSFIFSKPLLALQMLIPIQLTYVVLGYFPNVLSAVGSLSQLKHTAGYNQFQPSYSYNTNYYSQRGLIIAQQGNQFILNINFMAAALIGVGLLTILWKFIASFLWKEQILDQNSIKIQKTNKTVQVVKYIEMVLSKKIFAFLGLTCMVPSLFALSMQLRYKSSPLFQNYTTASYNTLAAITTIIFVFLALTQCLDSEDSKTLRGYAKHVQQTKIQVFFFTQLLVTVLFTGLIGILYVQYALFVIGIVPLGLYLYRSPYKDKPKFQRFTAFVCYFIILVNSALFLVADISKNQFINLIIAGLVLTIILMAQVLTIIRVILDKLNRTKNVKIKLTLEEVYQGEQEILEEVNNQSQRQKSIKVDMQKIQQLSVREHQQLDSPKEQNMLNKNPVQLEKQDFVKDEKPENNSDSQLNKDIELEKIKKKLRSELLQKRGGNRTKKKMIFQ